MFMSFYSYLLLLCREIIFYIAHNIYRGGVPQKTIQNDVTIEEEGGGPKGSKIAWRHPWTASHVCRRQEASIQPKCDNVKNKFHKNYFKTVGI